MTIHREKRFGGLRAALMFGLLVILLCMTSRKVEARNGVWTGSGEYDDPYLIEDIADFLEFREYVNSGRSAEDRYFLLVNDLDLVAICGNGIGSWTPIGSPDHPFKGHFSGGEKNIRNLYISGGNNVGLFGVNEGYIESVAVYGCVSGDENVAGIVGENRFSLCSCHSYVDLEGRSRVGGITGCNKGFIFNCANNGTIEASGEEAGGIAGFSADNIDYCTNAANVIAAGKVGGIAGYSKAQIMDCFTEESYEIKTRETESDRDLYVGGIVGITEARVEKCTNRASVLCTKSVAGGIVGKISGEWAYNCINEGEVRGCGTIGGIAGCFQGKEDQFNNTISKCSNSGKVSGTGNRVGGIVGDFSFCTLTECINKGDVEGKESTGGIAGCFANVSDFTNVTNLGRVQGENYTGGIAGKMDKTGLIRNCVNSGEVTGKDYTGGITGGDPDQTAVSKPGKIELCTNTKKVTGKTKTGGITGQCGREVFDCINKGAVTGTSAVAGLVGKTLRGIRIENNINKGDVTGTADSVGGIVGANENTPIKKCRNEGYVNGSTRVGGIVGDNKGIRGETRGVIEACQNEGEIKSTETDYTGGIAGYCSFADISGCENTGDISSMRDYTAGIAGIGVNVTIQRCGNRGSVISKQKYVGGIAGRIENSEVEDCYDRGMVSGGYDVGGIVGCVAGDEDLIARCYSKAGLKGIKSVSDSGYVGALYGKRESANVTLEFCYWYLPCAQKARGDIEGADESGQGFWAYSDERWFEQQNKFASWNFENVWMIQGGVPELQNQYDITATDGLGILAEGYITGGDGKHAANLCYIHTLEELGAFRDAVNAGDSYLGDAVYLCADLDLGGDYGRYWEPIGENLSMQFRGIFYGGNHVIRGIRVSASDGAGLFGCSSGTIRDLAAFGTVEGLGNYAGGIAGNSSGFIKNCFFEGDVNCNKSDSYVGGIAGFVTAYGGLRDCVHVGSVSVKRGYAGGVAGMQRTKTANISRCIHYDKLRPLNNVVCHEGGRAGSVVGQAINPSGVTDCYALSGCCANCIGYTPESSQADIKGGIMLVEEDFRRPEMFAGWNVGYDENCDWIMGADYPMLRSLSDYMILSPNGAEGDEQKLWMIKGQLKVPEVSYVREGYIFTCLNDKQDGSGTRYYEGDEVPGGTTLYARWIKGIAYHGYTAVKPENPDHVGLQNQTYDLLLDGKIDTKWCIELSNSNDVWALEFETAGPVKPCGYGIVTAEDTKMYPGRNPKNWKLEAKDSDGNWIVLDEVTNDETLQPRDACATFKEIKNNKEYRRYRISFKGLTSGKTFQLSELYLIIPDPNSVVSVKWYSGNTKVGEETYYKGDTPGYKGKKPEKASDAEYEYVFTGWDKELKPLTGDMTYNAVFKKTKRSYAITWKNDDGTVIDVTRAEYGTIPKHAAPSGKNDKQYTYTFSGWIPSVKAVTGDATYTASYLKTAMNAAVTGVKLNMSTVSVAKGKTVTLKATVLPEYAANKTVTWKSSNKSIAEVDGKGKITAKKPGKTTITVITKDGGKKASCTVTVILPVKSISFSKKTSTVLTGKTQTLSVKFNPSKASDKQVSFKSSNDRIATVDKNGKVKGISEGKATITAISNDGMKKATCKVTVKENSDIRRVCILPARASLKIGDTTQLKAVILPSNAKNKQVIWTVRDKRIATISEDGTLKGIKKGKTYVTVTTVSGKKTKKIPVIVTS